MVLIYLVIKTVPAYSTRHNEGLEGVKLHLGSGKPAVLGPWSVSHPPYAEHMLGEWSISVPVYQ